jgi:hypothetical protein
MSARENAERERAALQEEINWVQQSRLAELSTPMIPITEQVMVMPLIGTMDAQRARHVLESALSGAEAHGARAASVPACRSLFATRYAASRREGRRLRTPPRLPPGTGLLLAGITFRMPPGRFGTQPPRAGDPSRACGHWRAARLRQRVDASGGLDVRPKLAHPSGATGSPSSRPIAS